MTKLSCAIAIFAHNEERCLPDLLNDLARQDILQAHGGGSVTVLENGSSDRTAQVAREWMEERSIPGWDFKVECFPEGGKARTWNRWVHEFCPTGADPLIFLDGDIRLTDESLIGQLLETLETHPKAQGVSDTPMKDVEARQESLRNRISSQSSELARIGPAQLCGQCWAGRAETLRQIHLPNGLLVEDGFLKAMIVTDGFRSDEDPERFLQIRARHVFEAETRFGSLFRHERRILLGTLVNRALFLYLHSLREQGKDPSAWLADRHREDPEWLSLFSNEQLRKEPFFRQAREFLHLPLERWRRNRKAKLLPAALVRFIFNYAVALSSRRAVRKGEFRW